MVAACSDGPKTGQGESDVDTEDERQQMQSQELATLPADGLIAACHELLPVSAVVSGFCGQNVSVQG